MHPFLLLDFETKLIYLDVEAPEETFNKVGVMFWNTNSDKELLIDELKIEAFDEK